MAFSRLSGTPCLLCQLMEVVLICSVNFTAGSVVSLPITVGTPVVGGFSVAIEMGGVVGNTCAIFAAKVVHQGVLSPE